MYKKNGAQPWLWDMMDKPSFDGMPQPLKDAFLAINPDKDALYRMYERDVARMQHFTDIKDSDIEGIQAPALIICGDQDVCTPEHAVEMYRRIKNAQLAILPGGHGDYLGEITTLKPGVHTYTGLAVIEQFLEGDAKK